MGGDEVEIGNDRCVCCPHLLPAHVDTGPDSPASGGSPEPAPMNVEALGAAPHTSLVCERESQLEQSSGNAVCDALEISCAVSLRVSRVGN